MSDLHRRIRLAQIEAAEDVVIASIPKSLMERLREAEAELKAKGGCPGCGSVILAVHSGDCPELKGDLY